MRLFEILLLASCLNLLIYSWFFRREDNKIGGASCVVSGALMSVHFVLEGYRWQMLLIYAAVVLLMASLLLRYQAESDKLKMWRPLRNVLYGLLTFLILLSACLAAYLPVVELPKPEGPHRVGTSTLHFVDSNRFENLTEVEGDYRELMVQLWYPAENARGLDRAFLFPKDRAVFSEYMRTYSKALGLPAFVLDYWRYIKTNSFEAAEVNKTSGPYPLIILSHGMGTGRVIHTSQAENLASHGFVVAAIDHTYSTSATAFPDGRVTGLKTVLSVDSFEDISNSIGKIWLQDIDFVMEQLKKVNTGEIESRLKGAMDYRNTGIMGHSFGGATAFNAFYLDDRFKAGINMDGTLYELDNRSQISRPFMFMQSESFMTTQKKYMEDTLTEDELKDIKLTRERYNKIIEIRKKESDIIDHVVNSGGAMIYIEGAAHFNFTDLQLFSKLLRYTGMTGKINGRRGAYIINQYTLDFFNKHLTGSGGVLVEVENSKFPEVNFR